MSVRRMMSYLSLALLVLALAGIPMKSASSASDPPQDETLVAGRNVNMVSGTRLPWGDPWLQRQNEPSLAASSRNPMHLLAGANDYRTIDMPDNYKVPGIPPQAAARDAWLGLFKSFDGGQSWITTLLPGYPQDSSLQGLASPIHGFDAACDPSVRAGSNGMFYYSGIAFNRAGGAGAIFLARFIDNNNLEKIKKIKINDWQWVPEDDPIKYVDTRVVDTGNSGQFIDMPTVAVDIPRGGYGGTSTIFGQSIPNANVYLAYTVFLGNFDVNIRSRLMLVRSTNSGQTWSKPIKLSESQHIIQRPIIAIDPHDPTGNTIYVGFRRFAHGTTPGGIVICKSYDGGQTFTKPIEVETLLYPFDQAQAGSRFRTNSYPTMAVDGSGVVHIAWSQRMGSATAQARIVLKTSADGVNWSGIARPVDLFNKSGAPLKGNQFIPSLTFAAGRLLLAWYDQRETLSPDNSSGGVADAYPNRQTIDVRAAEAILILGSIPVFSRSYQVSRYLFFLELDASGNPVEEDGYNRAIQAEYNPPNLPLFQLGTRPFLGDYIDLAPAPFILPPPVANGSWAYNILPFGHPVTFHSAWTDNRDIRPPADGWWGDWVTYAPPNSDQDAVFNQQNPCANPNGTGMRNQNVYTANIGKGVFVGSPGNTKQLDIAENLDGGRRTFVVIVKNSTEFNKEFDVALDGIGGDIASLTQTDDTDSLHIAVAAYSSYSCTVFVDDASGQILPVKVNVYEGGLLVGYALLNPDATNLPVSDPDIPSSDLSYEKHNPRVMNPRVWNYDLGNQSEPNPRVMNPRVMNPRVMNPRVMNPRVMNPRVMNDSIVSYEVANPRVMNPRVMNTALTDVTWMVSNGGNTTSAYKFDIVSTYDHYFSGPGALIGQVLVYKMHLAPAGYQCGLYETHEDELLVNITNPRVMNNVPEEGQASTTSATSQTTNGEGPQDVTFYLAPGEEAYITFRVWDDDTTDNVSFDPQTVTAYVEAEAINTGETAPSYALPESGAPWVNPLPQIGYYPTTLSFYTAPGSNPPSQVFTINNMGGGTLNYTVTVDMPWLTVAPSSGTSSSQTEEIDHTVSVGSAGMAEGTYTALITISDPNASNNPVRIPVTLTVSSVPPPPPLSEWVSRYDTPIHGPDSIEAMTVDAAGNTYATGSVNKTYPQPNDIDYLTAKFDSSGNVLWAVTYDYDLYNNFDRDLAHAIALDPSGNVIVTGQSRGDMCTIKYDPLGIPLWKVRYHGGPAGYSDEALAVAVDSAGNIYVAGQGYRDGGEDDFVTIKYSPGGAELWARRYEGMYRDQPRRIAVDTSGNVYVTGRSENISDYSMFTISYDSSGNLRWSDIFDSNLGDDEAKDIALDPSGKVVVTGYSTQGDSMERAMTTINYDSATGGRLWTSIYDAEPSEGNALAVKPDGTVYVTGYRTDSAALNDYFTIRIEGTDGTMTWSAAYDAEGADDVAVDIALDSVGNIYITGSSGRDGSLEDFTTVKYAYSGGNQEWVRSYNGTGNGNDVPAGLGIDSSGNIYIAGSSPGSGTLTDFAAIKYMPALLEWSETWNGPVNGNDRPEDVYVDQAGNVYVTGYSVGVNGPLDFDYLTVKYDTSGNRLWVARYDGPGHAEDLPYAIAVDSSGNVVVTGHSYETGDNSDYTTIKYDADGNQLWVARHDSGTVYDFATDVEIDSSGNVIVTGRSFGTLTDYDYVTIKYDNNGNQLWLARYNGAGNQADYANALAVDSAGNVYVTGESIQIETPYFDNPDYATVKYDSNGNQLWVATYNGGGIDSAIAVALDTEGNVFVTGYSAGDSNDYMTIKYDTNGNPLWTARYDGPGGGSDYAQALAIDADGNAYVTGQSGGDGTGQDFATVKYDATGAEAWVKRHTSQGSQNDYANAIVIDSSGYIYVTGNTVRSMDWSEITTLKYSSSGSERWVARYKGLLWGNDNGIGVAVDPDNNVYVAAITTFYVIGPPFHTNYLTIKYRKEDF